MVRHEKRKLGAVCARFLSTIAEVPRLVDDHRGEPQDAFVALGVLVRPPRATKDLTPGEHSDSFTPSVGTIDGPSLGTRRCAVGRYRRELDRESGDTGTDEQEGAFKSLTFNRIRAG
jgi:hypothetical protein